MVNSNNQWKCEFRWMAVKGAHNACCVDTVLDEWPFSVLYNFCVFRQTVLIWFGKERRSDGFTWAVSASLRIFAQFPHLRASLRSFRIFAFSHLRVFRLFRLYPLLSSYRVMRVERYHPSKSFFAISNDVWRFALVSLHDLHLHEITGDNRIVGQLWLMLWISIFRSVQMRSIFISL